MADQFALARYHEDGSLDTTFDNDGKVLTDFGSTTDEGITSIVTDFLGRTVVAGWAENNNGSQFALARYNENGSLDTSFDQDGKVITDFTSSNYESALAIAIDFAGKIVVGGVASVNGSDQFALARYNEDGSLDKTFDNDGKVLTDFTSSSSEFINSIAIDHRGRIVASGMAQTNQGSQFALARYNYDGSLDKTFDGDGKVLTDFTSSIDEGSLAMAIDSTGQIVVGGWAVIESQTSQFALARYNVDGSLDTTFDNDGKVLTDFASSTNDDATTLAIDSFDRIVVGGWVWTHADDEWKFALARYNKDGGLDTTFDGDGKVITDFTSSATEGIESMLIDRYGRIVVAGMATDNSTGKTQFALARYNRDGSLDRTFDHDGKVLTDFSSADDNEISAITLDLYRRIVVGGVASVR